MCWHVVERLNVLETAFETWGISLQGAQRAFSLLLPLGPCLVSDLSELWTFCIVCDHLELLESSNLRDTASNASDILQSWVRSCWQVIYCLLRQPSEQLSRVELIICSSIWLSQPPVCTCASVVLPARSLSSIIGWFDAGSVARRDDRRLLKGMSSFICW